VLDPTFPGGSKEPDHLITRLILTLIAFMWVGVRV
jgi:hypothetical protein